ncbi:MAG TPA: hypothetical protein PKA29_01800 [Candidatus Saccharibacteria bacterium]|nr:hypothetical protein [Candidatus Saccharibacteria bacterium]
MKYMSVFVTILMTWLAVILMSAAMSDPVELFKLYVAIVFFTVVLFIIGFGGKSR